jgi:hypothetical protein
MRGGAVGTPPFVAAGSHHCAWIDHGQPSVHTTLSTDPGSTTNVHRPAVVGHFSILDVLAWLVRPTVVGQLLQHDDAPDTALTYGVGH